MTAASRRSGISCRVYHGELYLGEAEVFPPTTATAIASGKNGSQSFVFPFPSPNPSIDGSSNEKEIRISHLSPPSERCPPLAILRAISSNSVRCKLQSKSLSDHPLLHRLYLSCFQEFKSAVVMAGNEELHLVAMPSKVEKVSCFWCCSVQAGLYTSCMAMLNLRCLAIVFDLDETLIVANTMKSFEDRIDALSRKIDAEKDPVRISGMSAELKRYIEDKNMLKQYIDTNVVLDNGRSVSVQNEEVPQFPGSHERIVRPVIRLPESNIVLTRINPEIRDTSVFVRLRPAWEDLRSYLIAKGRKRFEVYVCTMAERDYAMEIWRLLDPDFHLINPKQLMNRVVCVKSGLRKSLQHVFQDGVCHPKMAMVIDDRLQVWDDKDQPRVHVVPAYTPYYAPQAEMATAVPVLCVARNVACNVRGGFFKEFDENLLRKIFELNYENEITDLPYAPDVSNYLICEDTNTGVNNNKDIPMYEGISGAEVEQRLTEERHMDEQQTECQLQPNCSSKDDEISGNQPSGISRGFLTESHPSGSLLFLSVLEEIGKRCNSKVEFRSTIGHNKEFHSSVEVLFGSEKVGIGIGRTVKDAQVQAAENALHNLANSYLSFIGHITGGTNREMDKLPSRNGNGFLDDIVSHRDCLVEQEGLLSASASEQMSQSNNIGRLTSVISGIQELCLEGQSIVFQDKTMSSQTLNEGDYCYQVELAGRILGQGVGSNIEDAKLQAAEVALRTLKADMNQAQQKHFEII